MSDFTVTVLDEPLINDLEEVPQLTSGSVDGKPDGLQFYYAGRVILGDFAMDLTFNVPQDDGEQHKVWIDYHGPLGVMNILADVPFYGKRWNTIRITGLEGAGAARFDGKWNYRGTNSEWTSQGLQMWPAARFDPRTVIADGVLRGTARNQHTITVVRANVGEALTETVIAAPDGNWSANLLPSAGTGGAVILETLPGVASRYAESKHLTIMNAPAITSPTEGADVKQQRPNVSGEGTPGATVRIYRESFGGIVYGEALVQPNGRWSTPVLIELPEGSFTFTAQQTLGTTLSAWAKGVTVTASNRPVITRPEPIFQEMNFQLFGTHSEAGATVQVFRDLTQDRVGASWPLTGENWEAGVIVPPGPVSLVAITVVAGLQSRRSAACAVKIRPPKLTGVKVEILADNSIRFSGSAYPGATVVITVLESMVEPPAEVVAVDGNWATTATGWPAGAYKIKAIQKVSDNAGGWIESTHEKGDDLPVANVPRVSAVTSTINYRPIVSGRGVNDATVVLLRPGGEASVLPDATVVNGQWTSTALIELGPLKDYTLHIRQCLDGVGASERVEHNVNIPPLAPGLNDPVEDGLSPRFSGTCWPGAEVKIWFSDAISDVHDASVSGASWSFRRPKEFAANELHTVHVTQVAASQTSAPASKTFTVRRTLLTPQITQPQEGGAVGREVMIKGDNGMKDATMQLFDAQYRVPVGLPLLLLEQGKWQIPLTDLPFGQFTVYAVQTYAQIPSEESKPLGFRVVLLPPTFILPEPGGKLSRTATIEGKGMPFGWLDIWLDNDQEPWLSNIPVEADGKWHRAVNLPVGSTTIRARQSFDFNGAIQESDYTQLTFDVVPVAPFIETPIALEHVGRRVVVSGFGVPGDTVSVALGIDRQSAVVLEDRTWSVTVNHGEADGNKLLAAKAICDGFESDFTELRVLADTYLPGIDQPAAGRAVSDPLVFAGTGEEGSGQVASWFNPEIKLTLPLTVANGQWRGVSDVSLRPGGNWCRFRQTITQGAKLSDWGVSARFEVLAAPSKKP